jgi:hypothetical protein
MAIYWAASDRLPKSIAKYREVSYYVNLEDDCIANNTIVLRHQLDRPVAFAVALMLARILVTIESSS